MKNKTLVLIFSWLLFVVGSFTVEYYNSEQTHKELIFSTARALFERTVVDRQWNAMHGGVYVPVTKDTQPNPYLEDPMRDIKVNDNLTLTKINPAYMTRQLAELSAKSGTVQIHLTSLKLLRPENRATSREQKALEAFEKGAKEVGETFKDGPNSKFFYMAPLKVEKECLKCHAKQGYKEGDIRGGISIVMPLPHRSYVITLILGNVVIGLMGVLGIILFGARLDKAYGIIQRQAVIDALTGIANRRAFMERMPVEFKRSLRGHNPLSVIMVDIDHFKAYNDTYGHIAGDECLKAIAGRIQETIKRPGDFCARYGGEEFIVLLSDTKQESAMLIAEQIRANVEKMKKPHEKSLPWGVVTISLGVATMSGDAAVSDEILLQQADKALYAAKENGRNRVEAFGPLLRNKGDL